MEISWAPFIQTVVESVVYCVIGVVMFAMSFQLINAMAPFSLRKELEEDQNTALGVVIGSVIIGLSLIIAAAVGN